MLPIRNNRGRVSTVTMVANGTETSYSHNVEQNRSSYSSGGASFRCQHHWQWLGLDAGGVAPKLSARETEVFLALGRSRQVHLRDGRDSGLSRGGRSYFTLENAKAGQLRVTTTRQAIVEALRRGALTDDVPSEPLYRGVG